MWFFFAAALLPGVYWDQGVAAADAIKRAGIERLYVPAGQEKAWNASGISAQVFEVGRAVKLPAPGVRYRMDVASATTIPWIDANGWRFQRNSGRQFLYEAPSGKAPLSAAEAFAYGADAVIHTDTQDLPGLGSLLAFLKTIGQPAMPALANIGIADDGSAQTGEVLNLLARRNLLFQIASAPDRKYDLNVQIGSPDYPKSATADPSAFAAAIRQKLTDNKRLLRIFGADVVLGRLEVDDSQVRVHLINYSGRKVSGLRVRVRGAYAHGTLAAFKLEHAVLADYNQADGGTEFTIPEMDAYAIVDLKK